MVVQGKKDEVGEASKIHTKAIVYGIIGQIVSNGKWVK